MIYFDNAATTKPSACALEKAKKFNEEEFFNPSALYRGGLSASLAIKEARETILKTLGASTTDKEVIFTSCGSESDNTAIFCTVRRGVFVTDKGEHSAVYKSFSELKTRGYDTEIIELDKHGGVDVEKLFNCVKEKKVSFVSIMHVNNETGAINDVNFIADKLKEINPKLVFHSDGVQAYGKLPFRLGKNVDLYSVSAHKIGGLKGVGVLVKRKGLNLFPLIFGGGQENGYRSGTENVFGIKTFEYAAKERYSAIKENFSKISAIKQFIAERLDKNVFTIISGLSDKTSSPYVLSVSAAGLRGEVLMHELETYDIIVGNGSACSSKNRYSRVIEACGYDAKVLDGVLRISFSPENTMEEAEKFVKIANESANKLKRMME